MKIGDKIRFIGTRPFWFTDIIANTKQLDKNKVYTVSSIKEYSNWTCIQLLETGTLEYNDTWFVPFE